MNAFHRLLRFSGTTKERAMPVWRAAVLRSARVLRWLKLQFAQGLQWLKLRPRVVFWAGGPGIVLALIFGLFVIGNGARWYSRHYAALAPLLTLVAGVSVAAVALIRHFAQTDANHQRRITESFSKAVEQLGSDKLEVRLGGIYSLERISKESPDDYWTVMENLTAFVRERSRRNEAERTAVDLEQRISRRAYFLWQEAGRPDGQAEDFWVQAVEQEEAEEEETREPPATDIAAVLTVIKRRSGLNWERVNGWALDFSGAALRKADLSEAYLAGALFYGETHLEGADLHGAHLEGADFGGAHLEGGDLGEAHLEGACLQGAHLEYASLIEAHLEEADLSLAYLESARFYGAHLDPTSAV